MLSNSNLGSFFSKQFDIIDEEEEDIEEFEFLQESSHSKEEDTDTVNFHQEVTDTIRFRRNC